MKQLSVSERVKEQARKQVLSYSIFRPESALVIALAIIGVGMSLLHLPWFPGDWWMWAAGGLIGEGAIVASSLRDEKFYRKLIDQLIADQFDLGKIRNPELRERVTKALQYRTLITQEIERRDDPFDERLKEAARSMEDWIAQIYRLAQGVDSFQQDPIIARDLQQVPRDLAGFQDQLRRSVNNLGDPVQEELRKTVEMKQAQWEALTHLRDTMMRARLQLDNTLAAMGTVYMQTKLIGNKDMDDSRAQRLRADMVEQVRALEDTAAAIDEVYGSRLAKA